MNDRKWQWMDNAFGGMGWFTDEDKQLLEHEPEFTNGHWRPIPPEESARMTAMIGHAAYEQA